MIIVVLCGYFLSVSVEIKVLHPNEKWKLGEYMGLNTFLLGNRKNLTKKMSV